MNTASKDKVVCQICGKTNHTAAVCWSRYEYSEQVEEVFAAMNLNSQNDKDFYADSGATTHMTNNPSMLDFVSPYNGNDMIYVGNGQPLSITHIGIKQHGSLPLNNILVVPQLKKNLMSVAQLTSDAQCSFEFNSSGFVIKDKNNRILAQGNRCGNLYALD